MVRRETRPMNAREAAALRAAAEWASPVSMLGTLKWVAIWTAGLFVSGLLANGLAAMTAPAIVGSVGFSLLGFAAILCLYFIVDLIRSHIRWSHQWRDYQQREVPEIQAALNDATVDVMAVRATAVATIEQFEDEGDGFIFDIGNGQLLILKGQEYRPDDDAAPWPNTEFEIVRSAVGNRWIGIFCTGAPLTPTLVLQSSECKHDVIGAQREDVVNASMEAFIRSIRAVA